MQCSICASELYGATTCPSCGDHSRSSSQSPQTSREYNYYQASSDSNPQDLANNTEGLGEASPEFVAESKKKEPKLKKSVKIPLIILAVVAIIAVIGALTYKSILFAVAPKAYMGLTLSSGLTDINKEIEQMTSNLGVDLVEKISEKSSSLNIDLKLNSISGDSDLIAEGADSLLSEPLSLKSSSFRDLENKKASSNSAITLRGETVNIDVYADMNKIAFSIPQLLADSYQFPVADFGKNYSNFDPYSDIDENYELDMASFFKATDSSAATPGDKAEDKKSQETMTNLIKDLLSSAEAKSESRQTVEGITGELNKVHTAFKSEDLKKFLKELIEVLKKSDSLRKQIGNEEFDEVIADSLDTINNTEFENSYLSLYTNNKHETVGIEIGSNMKSGDDTNNIRALLGFNGEKAKIDDMFLKYETKDKYNATKEIHIASKGDHIMSSGQFTDDTVIKFLDEDKQLETITFGATWDKAKTADNLNIRLDNKSSAESPSIKLSGNYSFDESANEAKLALTRLEISEDSSSAISLNLAGEIVYSNKAGEIKDVSAGAENMFDYEKYELDEEIESSLAELVAKIVFGGLADDFSDSFSDIFGSGDEDYSWEDENYSSEDEDYSSEDDSTSPFLDL